MPTNTDLVTDLPADFEVFGQAVATSMADLLGGTSGQILAKNSNTDMDFVWIANDQGDITGITATSPLTGGGTSGAITVGIQASSTTQSGAVQLSDSTSTTSSVLAATPTAVKSAYDLANAAIPKSTVTTAGDVIYATGSGAVTRLGIGTAGQVLTVNGGATAPSWATPSGGGGMTVIASGSLSGSGLSLTSISGSYKNLQLVLRNAQPSTNTDWRFKINNNTSSIYDRYMIIQNATTFTTYATQSSTSFGITWNNPKASTTTTAIFDLYDYANTTSPKQVQSAISYEQHGTGSYDTATFYGTARTNLAVTRVDVTLDSGTFTAGTYILYGVN